MARLIKEKWRVQNDYVTMTIQVGLEQSGLSRSEIRDDPSDPNRMKQNKIYNILRILSSFR